MIEKYIEAMLNGDYKALAACFAPHCRYFDYCPIGTNRDNYHVYGREAIEMFFHHKFTFRILSITDPVIESETSANFLVAYGGTYLSPQEFSCGDLQDLRFFVTIQKTGGAVHG